MSCVHRSLEDITRTELVREIAGRHAWKVPADDARAAVGRWVHEIAVHADDTPTGRYIACRAEQLLDATAWPCIDPAVATGRQRGEDPGVG